MSLVFSFGLPFDQYTFLTKAIREDPFGAAQ